jgi:protein involved in polysaccharide export with SLBB domain
VVAAVLSVCFLTEPTVLMAQLAEEVLSDAPADPLGLSADPGSENLFGADPNLIPGEGLEGAVVGTEYRLGPGDVLAINIWGPEAVALTLAVTLEGRLLIPDVGEVDVNGLLLSDAKGVIRAEMLRKFRNVDIGVTLVKIRKFKVHVLGQVDRPGTYISSAVDRVSIAIARAGGLKSNGSRRLIQVQNGDSVRVTADLMAFFRTGSVEQNPSLRDGDLIYVPHAENHVVIRGDVNRQGPVEFVSGDRFSDLIGLVSGFTAEAFLDTIEVARYTESMRDPIRFLVLGDGRLVPVHASDQGKLPEILGTVAPAPRLLPLGEAPTYPDFELAPQDFIFVRRDPDIRGRSLVEILGEVVFPGFYPVDLGETRISDVVAMAGGLTSDASLIDSRLVRRSVIGQTDPEYERLKNISRADMDKTEYAYFKLKAQEVPGLMVVDFHRAIVEKDSVENILIEPADLIRITKRRDFISVLGTVNTPGNVTYKPGMSAKEYVNLAGGFTADADVKKARIRLVEGGWLPYQEAGALRAGDAILVPEKQPIGFWEVFRTTLTITLQVLTIWLIVDRAVND